MHLESFFFSKIDIRFPIFVVACDLRWIKKISGTLNNLLKKSKLLIYLTDIGFIDPIKSFIGKTNAFIRNNKPQKAAPPVDQNKIDKEYLANFESLVDLYGYDNEKNVLLLDVEETSPLFITYLKENNFGYTELNS